MIYMTERKYHYRELDEQIIKDNYFVPDLKFKRLYICQACSDAGEKDIRKFCYASEIYVHIDRLYHVRNKEVKQYADRRKLGPEDILEIQNLYMDWNK